MASSVENSDIAKIKPEERKVERLEFLSNFKSSEE